MLCDYFKIRTKIHSFLKIRKFVLLLASAKQSFFQYFKKHKSLISLIIFLLSHIIVMLFLRFLNNATCAKKFLSRHYTNLLFDTFM